MWKFLKTLLVIMILTSLIAADERCKRYHEKFHTVCVDSDDVITSVRHERCIGDVEDQLEFAGHYEGYLQNPLCHDRLVMNPEDVSGIGANALANTSFIGLRFLPSYGFGCRQKLVHTVPESFNGLSSLQDLQLQCTVFNELERLPQFLSKFPKLKVLELSYVNITDIPSDTFTGIHSGLLVLSINDNQVEFIKDRTFRDLHNLHQLRLDGNQLTDLSPDLFDGLDALAILSLSGNRITVIRKDTFGKLPKLTGLDLSRNQIREIGSGIFPASLETLSMNRNRITVIHNNTFSHLPKLRILSLDDNKIHEIEAGSFSSASSLNWLRLNYNELECLSVGVFKDLPNLTYLELIRNKIRILQKNFFQGLPKLYHFQLNGNLIQHIKPNAFSNITTSIMSLRGNKLEVLEPNMFSGLNLHFGKLDLDENPIVEIKEQAFSNLTLNFACIKLPSNITEFHADSWGVDQSGKHFRNQRAGARCGY